MAHLSSAENYKLQVLNVNLNGDNLILFKRPYLSKGIISIKTKRYCNATQRLVSMG